MERNPFRIASVLYTTKLKFSRKQCCRPGCLSRIPDHNFFHLGSRIRIEEFKYFNPKKMVSKLLKYDPGCSPLIRILIFYPSQIPDPGVKKAPDPGSRIRNTGRKKLLGSSVTTSSGIEKYFSTARQLNNPFAAMLF
jgi:hypothetical protein